MKQRETLAWVWERAELPPAETEGMWPHCRAEHAHTDTTGFVQNGSVFVQKAHCLCQRRVDTFAPTQDTAAASAQWQVRWWDVLGRRCRRIFALAVHLSVNLRKSKLCFAEWWLEEGGRYAGKEVMDGAGRRRCLQK